MVARESILSAMEGRPSVPDTPSARQPVTHCRLHEVRILQPSLRWQPREPWLPGLALRRQPEYARSHGLSADPASRWSDLGRQNSRPSIRSTEWRPPPANRIPRYCSIRSSGYSHPPRGLLNEISVGGVPLGYDREFDDDNKAIGASAGRPRAQPLRTIRGFRENRPRRWGKGIPAVSGCSSRRPSETSEEFRVAMINQDWTCGVLAFAAHSPTSSSRAPGALLLITSVCHR